MFFSQDQRSRGVTVDTSLRRVHRSILSMQESASQLFLTMWSFALHLNAFHSHLGAAFQKMYDLARSVLGHHGVVCQKVRVTIPSVSRLFRGDPLQPQDHLVVTLGS